MKINEGAPGTELLQKAKVESPIEGKYQRIIVSIGFVLYLSVFHAVKMPDNYKYTDDSSDDKNYQPNYNLKFELN